MFLRGLFLKIARRNQDPVAPRYPVDPRVPSMDTWAFEGIVGRITSGPSSNEWVFAETYREPDTGNIDYYALNLPDDCASDTFGSFVMDDGVVDGPRPPGEGGLIDYLTAALGVEWHADPAVIERVLDGIYAENQPEQALATFRELSALWLVGDLAPNVLARAAADALATGWDTPALRDVAGLYCSSTFWEIRPVLEQAWEQLARPLPSNEDHLAILALRAQCWQFITGQLTVGGLTTWTHSVVGHDGPALAQPLVDLNDGLEVAGDDVTPTKPRELAETVKRAASVFLAETNSY